MEIYLVMFASCFFCCYLSSHIKKKILSLLFAILSILIPAIIAGYRDLSIGTDISVYGEYMHYVASHSGIGNFFSIFGYQDILYSILTIIVGGVFEDIHVFLFILQLLNCAIIYKACKNHADKVPVCVSYLLFLMSLYFRQLNLLRQGLSLSLSILAISYLLRDNKKFFFILSILAVLSHFSAIILLLIYLIYKNYKRNNKNKYFFPILYFLLISILLLFFPFLRFITSIGFLPGKYTYEYFLQCLNVGFGIDSLGTVFKLFWCLVIIMISYRDRLKKKIANYGFLFHMVFIDFILWNYNIFILYIDRLSFYFGYTYVLFLLPQLVVTFGKAFRNRVFFYLFLIALFMLYWYLRFVIQNAGNVYPYIAI